MRQKPISELRRRMLEDMAARKMSETTCHNYIRHIAEFAKFLGRPPDMATADDVRRFQVHMSESGVRAPTLNTATSALRFFFGTTLDRPELARHLARVHYPRPSPRVVSPEEVGRLLEAAPGPGLKYKAALSTAYGTGLGAGEVVMLRVSARRHGRSPSTTGFAATGHNLCSAVDFSCQRTDQNCCLQARDTALHNG